MQRSGEASDTMPRRLLMTVDQEHLNRAVFIAAP
jgi:hypothetical protein